MRVKKATRIVNIFKRIFRVREWLDFDRVKAATIFLINNFKKVFIIQKQIATKAAQKELQHYNFKKAVKQMRLTPEALEEKQASLFRLSLIMCVVAFSILGYAIYQLFYEAYLAVGISLILSLIALALAFRYHFWYFQIREHRLGCSIREWYAALKEARRNKS